MLNIRKRWPFIFRVFFRWGLRILFAGLLLLVFAVWTLGHYYAFGIGHKGGNERYAIWALRVSDQEVSLWKIELYSDEPGFERFGCKKGRQMDERLQKCSHSGNSLDRGDLLYLTSGYEFGRTGKEWFDFLFTRSAGSGSGSLLGPHTPSYSRLAVPCWVLS